MYKYIEKFKVHNDVSLFHKFTRNREMIEFMIKNCDTNTNFESKRKNFGIHLRVPMISEAPDQPAVPVLTCKMKQL